MLQPGTLTSTSLGRVRVSSAVCAIASPPGSPPKRYYTQVPRVLPLGHAPPPPSPPQDTPPRTLVSPPPCPCWLPAPPHPTLSPPHLGKEVRTTPGPRVPRRSSPSSPHVWPPPSHAGPAPRTAQRAHAPEPRPPLLHDLRSS